MEHLNISMLEKLCGLLFFLTRSKAEFEMVADEVEDCNLKTALNGLSSESDQYANEITTQLKTLGINGIGPKLLFEDSGEENDNLFCPPENARGNELMKICDNSENSITKAYNEILNEYFPFSNLRDIMSYQADSLKLAFRKIKTLNTA
ncbi:MAG: hypothetical protein ABJA37_09650, partial [Ferruginibacter sp.]